MTSSSRVVNDLICRSDSRRSTSDQIMGANTTPIYTHFNIWCASVFSTRRSVLPPATLTEGGFTLQAHHDLHRYYPRAVVSPRTPISRSVRAA